MKAGKVQLERARVRWHASTFLIIPLLAALPFYRSRHSQAKYYHRVRSGEAHIVKGKYSHTGFTFWCGGQGFIGSGKGGFLAATVPPAEILCATCEGRTVGAGLDGARTIHGRPVMFSPRK